MSGAASIAALDVIVDEDLPGRSLESGDYFKEQLKQIDHPSIKEVRGRGLFLEEVWNLMKVLDHIVKL
ncbi:hypothetical protein WOC68_00435 [Staphylococcus aureus]